MTLVENPPRVEQVEIKRDLPQFVARINGIGKEFGLNPHIEQVRAPNSRASYRWTIAVISETGLAPRLKQYVGLGNIARIIEASPKANEEGIDYFFVYNNLNPRVLARLFRFTSRVEKATGVGIFLVEKDNYR